MTGEITRESVAIQHIYKITKKRRKLDKGQVGGIPISKRDAEGSSVSRVDQVNMLCDVWRRQVFWNIKGMGEMTVFLL